MLQSQSVRSYGATSQCNHRPNYGKEEKTETEAEESLRALNFNTPGMGTYGADWHAHGYSGCGNVSPLIDSEKNRPAIIAGGSFTVFDDIDRIAPRLDDPLIFAVNDVGMFLPIVNHWVSLHAENLATWKTVRWLHSWPVQTTNYHSYETKTGYTWDHLNPIFALSGYFAMQIAWIMGCAPIVLCGCPGSPARRFFESVPRPDGIYDTNGGVRDQLITEMNRVPGLKKVVRSMSGWTREYFGGLSSWPPSHR